MKFLKWLLIIIAGLFLIGVIFIMLVSKSLPENGVSGDEADKMALKMEKSLGKEHWHDIQYVQWSFMGMHHFLWDKHRNMVRVKYDEKTVYFQPGSEIGAAFENITPIEGEKGKEVIKQASDFFNNDMFWLIAPFKSFDEGVKREIVSDEGEDRLLISFVSGGTTPGDAYLWKLAEDGTPLSYRMWTQIIPVGGLEVTWESYFTLGNGVKLSHFHKGIGPVSISVSDVSVGYNLEEVNCEKDPFKILIEE